jgi:hypothetical protein
MSIATEISRIQTDRNAIRAKLVELGLAASTATLDACTTAIENIANKGAVNAQVKEGETYTIPAGYHNGSGVVAGVSGGGNYSLQEKSVTPTKQQQSVTADSGYYGLSGVTVAAIPEAYQDVSSTTAVEGDVLTGKVFVLKDGTVKTGTMANNGAVTKTLDVSTVQYVITAGYHSGAGKVSITLETKSVTPTKSEQTITPASGKVLSKVTVNPIPDAYQDVTGVTAFADTVLEGSVFVDSEGNEVEGGIPVYEAVSKRLDTTTTSVALPNGYYDGDGDVGIVLETKTATPTKATQNVTPTAGKVLSKVTVNAIPAAYQDVTGVTAVAAEVLDGKKIVSSTGVVVEGSMPNNGSTSKSIDGLTTMSATIPAGYTTGGTVTLTGDIEAALKDI